jgi:hypothetical protein
MGHVIQPIKPEEILDKKIATIPDHMIQAVNELIAKNWTGNMAEIKKEEILQRYFKISGKMDDRANRDKLYDDHSLDFEFAYQKEGWSVNYESPGMGDSDFEPYYIFKVKNK